MAATMDVMTEDEKDNMFKDKMNLFVDGISGRGGFGVGDQPHTTLETNLRHEEAFREVATGRDPDGAKWQDFRCRGWEECPWLDSNYRFKVPLNNAITASAKKAKLDPWLKLEASRLDDIAQKQGIPLKTIMAQEYAVRCRTNAGLSGFITIADLCQEIEEYGGASDSGCGDITVLILPSLLCMIMQITLQDHLFTLTSEL